MKITELNNIKALYLKVTGLVQGVGFRPFIYNLAKSLDLNGWVKNTNMNVEIVVEGKPTQLQKFIDEIKTNGPEAAEIQNIESKEIEKKGYNDFTIESSQNQSNNVTQVSPDIAVCDKCMDDLKNQSHRINYPFVNCTNCGPRFTIIQNLPYDRPSTTMSVFEMCEKCSEEYNKVTDRRFHAQPISCNSCGPEYRLIIGNKTISDFKNILHHTKKTIEEQGIITIKGLGGFHLMCDAKSEEAVAKIRKIKLRDEKPFAVLFKDIEAIKEYCHTYSEEIELLTSRKRPVVILHAHKSLAKGISGEFKTIGAILPYMPIHYLLFEGLGTNALVLTSANLSGNPILIDNSITYDELHKKTDAILDYNREIHNRTDDSVCQVVDKEIQVLRRSRGYAPQPVFVKTNVEGILATGAELVNCFCIGKGQQAILSQHIGDLKNFETYQFYEETYERFKLLFKFEPRFIAHDLHPDYLSTHFAQKQQGKKIGVQHHHAHIASVMAEHNVDEKVIGVCLDGTGYGTDGQIWGGEIFTCDFVEFNRESHFEYVNLPGGDKATEEPWRMAASYLHATFGNNWMNIGIPLVEKMKKEIALFDVFSNALSSQKYIQTSSTGRLFDGVSALTGLCFKSAFHAQAPMLLENSINNNEQSHYEFELNKNISFIPTIEEIVSDIKNGTELDLIAARFHNTVIEAIFQKILDIRKETGLQKVILSGGSFQNRILMQKLKHKLIENKLMPFTGNNIPVNDGGIALGQLMIASKRIEIKYKR